MTVGELSERMDAAELMEWTQYDEVHLPDEWVRNALLCLTVVRLAGNKGAKLDDFLPARRQAEPPAPAPEAMTARIKAWAAARIAAQKGKSA